MLTDLLIYQIYMQVSENKNNYCLTNLLRAYVHMHIWYYIKRICELAIDTRIKITKRTEARKHQARYNFGF